MEFKQTFSREYLQTERARYQEVIRVQEVMRHVESNHHLILGAAREGKTQCIIDINQSGIQCGEYKPTTDNLLEGYRSKFPDCRVEPVGTWEPTIRITGIIIDWS